MTYIPVIVAGCYRVSGDSRILSVDNDRLRPFIYIDRKFFLPAFTNEIDKLVILHQLENEDWTVLPCEALVDSKDVRYLLFHEAEMRRMHLLNSSLQGCSVIEQGLYSYANILLCEEEASFSYKYRGHREHYKFKGGVVTRVVEEKEAV